MTDKVTSKRCSVCKEIKDLSLFYPKKGRDNKYISTGCSTCKVCTINQSNVWMTKKFGSYRNYNLIRLYGITSEDYDRMYEDQQGLCVICEGRKILVVDHCHSTGKVRGLLCHGCNTGLGRFEGNMLFDKAKEYVNGR